MQNNYRHMDDGSTLIEVLDEGEVKEVIIDTEDFEKVTAVPGIWSIWRRKGKNILPTIGTCISKKNITMARLITDCPEGKAVYNLTRNFLDLRQINLVIANVGETNSRAFMAKVEQLMEERQLSFMDPHVESGPQVEKESPVPQPNSLMIQEIKTYIIRNGNGDSITLNEDEFKALINYQAV